MKRLFATITIALAAMFVFCSYCEAKKHKTVVVSVFEREFKHPIDYHLEKVLEECDSLIDIALGYSESNCIFKATTDTFYSSYYIFKKEINGCLFVECYHIPSFSSARMNCGAWMSADELYKSIYDPKYIYEVGYSPVSFRFVKQSIIQI